MCASELPANRMTQSDSSLYNLSLAAFSSAIFISAALLFAVEPMFTKMVLPRLGVLPLSGQSRWCSSRQRCLAAMPMHTC